MIEWEDGSGGKPVDPFGPKSPGIAAKVALARGAQAAVVKLKSYAAGPVRVGALVSYISREGTEPTETETGELLTTKQELEDRVAYWLETYSDKRKGSKDVLSFVLELDRHEHGGGDARDMRVRAALDETLQGHKYAYSLRTEEDRTFVSVVMTARSGRRLATGHDGSQRRHLPIDRSEGITGVLVGTGDARYPDEPGDQTTPYADLQLASGEVERVWGLAIPDALTKTGVAGGETIRLKMTGKERVTVQAQVFDQATGAFRTEEREVDRNAWEATVLDPAAFEKLRRQAQRPAPANWRLRGTPAELGRIKDLFVVSFGGEAEISGRGTGHGVEGAIRHLRAMSDGGRAAVYTDGGKTLAGRDALTTLAESWQRSMGSQQRRDVMHLILSSRAGTDPKAFLDASRAFLKDAYPNHEYMFVMHNEGKHVHVHAAVVMTDTRGKRIDPNITHFRRWRALLAEKARARGIDMQAVERTERARQRAFHDGDRYALDRSTIDALAGDKAAIRRRQKLVERLRRQDPGAILAPRSQRQFDKMYMAHGEWALAALQVATDPALSQQEREKALRSAAEQFERVVIAIDSVYDRQEVHAKKINRDDIPPPGLLKTIDQSARIIISTALVETARAAFEETHTAMLNIASMAPSEAAGLAFVKAMRPLIISIEKEFDTLVARVDSRDTQRAGFTAPSEVADRRLPDYRDAAFLKGFASDRDVRDTYLRTIYGSAWGVVSSLEQRHNIPPQALNGLYRSSVEGALRYLDREKELSQSEKTIKQLEAKASTDPSAMAALEQERTKREATLSARARDQGTREAAVKIVNAARLLAGLDPIQMKTSPAIGQQQPRQPSPDRESDLDR